MTRRLLVISDLHVGGGPHPMLGHPDLLVDFLRHCSALAPPGENANELVINGDFVDFLAEPPLAPWTETEQSAVEKLRKAFDTWPDIFDALATCIGRIGRFTILLGNHDIELAYPRVREALLRRLETSPHRCLFITNNEAYRVGDVLIEHGNRYDPWNAIDHDGLREIVSAASRRESWTSTMQICPGSRFVHEFIGPLKERYHFIDLLKPEDKLVALLVTALEPVLKADVRWLFAGATQWAAEKFRNARWAVAGGPGGQPGQPHLVGKDVEVKGTGAVPDYVSKEFGEELRPLDPTLVGKDAPPVRPFPKESSDSLGTLLREGKPIDDVRLKKLQVAFRAKLADDASFDEKNSHDAYASAAEIMLSRAEAKVVIMGHTHLSRDVRFVAGRYVNTGTWADLIRVRKEILADTEEARAAFSDWLKRLATNALEDIREAHPSYADLSLDQNDNPVGSAPILRHYDRAKGLT
jgi:UDP-2,3-diacylglucosamine pyrophosphatase LpxH